MEFNNLINDNIIISGDDNNDIQIQNAPRSEPRIQNKYYNKLVCNNLEPVVSYGLMCFYKKKYIINKVNNTSNTINTINTINTPANIDTIDVINNINNINKLNEINKKLYTHIYNNTQCVNPKITIMARSTNTIITNETNTIITNKNANENATETPNTINNMCEIKPDTINNNNQQTAQQTIQETQEITKDVIILVQRKYTIGFIEFMRGKYDVNNKPYIIKLFNMMTFNEIQIIKDINEFDDIRHKTGLLKDLFFNLEYDDAKRKFNILTTHIDGNMITKLLLQSYVKWTSPEWGIPKGRKHNKESEIMCAIREFTEETGITAKDLTIYRNIKPLEEIYTGINGIVYKHIYYIATIKTPGIITEHLDTHTQTLNFDILNEKKRNTNGEIGSINLFTNNECNKLIRPYYTSKRNIIKKGFQIMNNLEYYFE